MYYKTNYKSPVGNLTIVAENDAVIGLWIENQKYFGGKICVPEINNDDKFIKVKNWLDRYFAGEEPKISELTLSPIGSDFQNRVWEILCQIPYGEVVTYGDIAKRISTGNSKMSAQAVGGAVGHNPISIIIPCHRVIGSNGSLTGYAAGIDVKLKLLQHENFDVSKLHIP